MGSGSWDLLQWSWRDEAIVEEKQGSGRQQGVPIWHDHMRRGILRDVMSDQDDGGKATDV